MRIADFDYDLPPGRIAREPARPRDSALMMILDRRTGRITDSVFRRLPECLEASDVLVLNDTRVLRARLYGTLKRESGASRKIEVLFVPPLTGLSSQSLPSGAGTAGGRSGLCGEEGRPDGRVRSVWDVMCRPGKRIRPGDRVVFAGGVAEGILGEPGPDGLRRLEWRSRESVEFVLDRYGHVPLPPYIGREDTAGDAAEYQTVYAASPGSIAAPTAGLHFTEPVVDALRQRGILVLKITLHVGIGTFIPVRSEDPRQHVLKPERFEIGRETAERLNEARRDGRRIIAAGTTTARTLEYVFGRSGRFEAGSGNADLYILPGYEFRAVDGLLTNFHLPRTTLIMLVSAFASREVILAAYRHAIQKSYRFYSYGDCMLVM